MQHVTLKTDNTCYRLITMTTITCLPLEIECIPGSEHTSLRQVLVEQHKDLLLWISSV